jgi:hydrogenase-4 component B
MQAGSAVEAAGAALEFAHVTYSALPVVLVTVPLIGAALVVLLGKRWPAARNAVVVGVTGLALLGAVAMIGPVAADRRIGSQLPGLLGRLDFTVDSFGLLFALFTTFVWFCSTLYSLDYMKHEHAHDRYHATSLVVLAANLGVVLAGDLITLYLFFEMLGLVAFLLVVHTETKEAKRASVKYWWMTVIGGFALIGGIFLTYAMGGTGAIAPIPFKEGTEALRWAAASLLILGFGVKAGMLPVHVWLPDAHPVAPSPASALLSGVMIKAGAYGIFRTLLALMRPEISQTFEKGAWAFTSQLGLIVLWIGVATMFIGVGMALGQHNAKRMLAYHSVSQMGFILAGLGAAGYLGAHGAMGVAGGLFHVVNHGLFKSALFLGVGAVFFRTAELDMYKLGGLWKRMPLTFLFTLIAAFGITGVPLFNGFVSKSLIHHAIVEAAAYHGLVSLGIAEKIFIVTCGGTVCSFIKLIGLVFLGKPKRDYGPGVKDPPPRMLVAMGLLSTAIIALGVMPQVVIRRIFAPGLEAWGLNPEILEEYLYKYFLSAKDIKSVGVAFAIGAVIFVVGMKFGLFHLHAPKWFGVDFWYRKTARGLLAFCAFVALWYDTGRDAFSRALRSSRVWYRSEWMHLERSRRRLIMTLTTGAPGLRDQHFVHTAYVALERERQATVRTAISAAMRHIREWPDNDPSERKATLDAVRDIAGYMTGRLCKERMGVVSDLVRYGLADEVRHGFEPLVHRLVPSRDLVTATALSLAGRRMAGENVTRDISAAVNRALSDERFDVQLAALVPRRHPLSKNGKDVGQSAPDTVPVGAALRAHHNEGLTGLEKSARWLVDVARLAIDAVTQERAGWAVPDRFNEESIVGTRRAIQRYARDMSFNVAMIVIVMFAFIVSLASRT